MVFAVSFKGIFEWMFSDLVFKQRGSLLGLKKSSAPRKSGLFFS